MLRIRLACWLFVLLAGVAHAGIDNAGTTAGNFLSVGTGAGILSMGGATLGAGRDLHAATWNPAALGRLGGPQLAFSHATLAEQSSQEWLALGGRVGRDATRWAVTALYQGDGSFDGRDISGAPTGSFSVSSMALGLQLARPIGDRFTAGLSAHWLTDRLGDVRGQGVGFDAGVQARAGAFGFGAAARNVGGSMSYDAGRFDLPAVFGVGTSWSDERTGVSLALDANFPSAYYNDVRLGAEWRWQERVALRAGYRMELGAETGEPLGGPSFGLGTGVNGAWMDYAFLANGSAEQGQHRLAITLRPTFLNRSTGDARTSSAPAADAPVPPAPALAAAPVAQPVPEAEPAPARTETRAADAPTTESAGVDADAMYELPPPGALSPGAAPRARRSAARIQPSAPVRVVALKLPTVAEREAIAAATAPASAPKPVATLPAPTVVAPAPARSAVAPTISEPATEPTAAVPAPAPTPALPTPARPAAPVKPTATSAPAPAVAAAPAPTAPAPTAPAPIAQVASSAPRIVVVTRPAEPIAQPAPPVARPASVTVGDNESLADIARRWKTSVAAIMMENNMVTERVKKGQKLKLPAR